VPKKRSLLADSSIAQTRLTPFFETDPMKPGFQLNHARLQIELAPTRLEIALVNGSEITKHFATQLNLPAELEPWLAAVAGLGTVVKDAVAPWKLGEISATVVYAAPSTVAGVHACPLTAGQAAAIQAAALTLGESAGFDLASNATDAQVLARDPDTTSVDAPPCFHCLAIADREVTLAALAQLCTAAGASLSRAIPLDALTLASATQQAMTDAGATKAALDLHFAERSAAIVGVDKGRILFVRHVAIGSDTLAAALTGEGKLSTPEGTPVRFDQAQAAELLLRTGIPGRGELVDALTGIRGEALLPLLQPAIQRLVVEIRQSVRFGLSEAARKTVSFRVSGLGAQIPRLESVIAEQINLPTASAAAPSLAEQPRRPSPTFVGDLAKLVRVSLLPAQARRRVAVARVVAMGVLGFDYMAASAEVGRARQKLASLEHKAAELRPIAEVDKRVQVVQQALFNARARMRDRMPVSLHWHSVLAMLAQQTPPAVRLSEVNLALQDGKPVARLQGRTYVTPGVDSNAAIKQLLDNLSGIPLVKQARLGATQRFQAQGGITQSFELTVHFVDIPSSAVVSAVDAPPGGAP
jgi:Tfp pilus assembly protein PilN